jgi:hypothetical protein
MKMIPANFECHWLSISYIILLLLKVRIEIITNNYYDDLFIHSTNTCEEPTMWQMLAVEWRKQQPWSSP